MRKSAGLICGLATAFGLLTITTLPPARADKPVAIEKEFLGIRMLQTYKQVLARYGAPNYVFRIGDQLLLLDARNLKGEITGGVVGIDNGGSSTGTNGGGAAGGGGGGKLGGGPPASSGGAGGGIPPQYAQYAQRGGGGRGPQGGGAPGSSGGGGAPAASGGGAPAASGGNAGGAQGDGDQTFGSSGGFMWAYHYPKQELAYIYVFNKDGRVEVIIERGRLGGQKTSRGVGLGDSIEAVYKTYGWTDSIKAERDNMFSLYYNDKYHAQFVTVKNKVIGVIVALRETQKLQFLDGSGGSTGSTASGGPGGGGRLPGGGGAPGSAGGGTRTLQGAGGGKRFPGAVGGGGGAG